jgi:pyrroloquinoline quinone (PQQ) biosynthesis protein C
MDSPSASKAYSKHDLSKPEVILNLHFLRMMEEDLRKHECFDHPFLVRFSKGAYSERGMKFALIQFSKHIRLFTSCLAHLLGMAPDIRGRIVLFDNLNEELGKGELGGTHYMLYLRMLYSLEISQEEIDRTPTMVSMDLLNDGLNQAVKRSFTAGLAWLGLGGELPIPNNFPYLAQGVRKSFAAPDMRFFERHGGPDQAHNDDSNMLLAMQLNNDADRNQVRSEVAKSLFLRAAVWSELGEQTARM